MVMLGRVAIFLAACSAPLAAQEAEPAVEAAAEVVPGPFIIFFDWDGRSIARDDGDILADVIAAYRANSEYRLRLVGHSDRSGPAGHNRVLARGRAVVVRDYLAEQGIPTGAMELASAGEERPLIATADGVREAQNRRVEIEFIK